MTSVVPETPSAPGFRIPLLVAGFLTGFLSAFFGIGGGVLMVPILGIFFRLPPRTAAGTSLGVVVFIAAAGMAGDLLDPVPAHRPALLAALGILSTSIPAARFAARRASRVPAGLLRRIFAGVLLFGALNLLGLLSLEWGGGWFVYEGGIQPSFLLLPVLGLLVGTLSALLGIGGGVLMVPALALLFRDLPLTRCRATSLLVVVPSAFVGFRTHLGEGTALLSYVRALVPSCLLGAAAGVWTVHRVSGASFRLAFGLLLLGVCVKLLLENRR